MTPNDQGRVQEARERLEAADHASGNADPAIRLVEVQAPKPSEPPLRLHRGFSVISGLGQGPRQAVAATVDGIRVHNDNIGLTAIVESYGRRVPRARALDGAPAAPGRALVPLPGLAGASSARTAEGNILVEVIDTIQRAIALTGAEYRGAEAAASEVAASYSERVGASSIVPSGETVAVRTEDEEMLDALDLIAPAPEAVAELEDILASLNDDEQRTRLEAAVSQARAARERLLPGDGRDAAVLAELSIAEADGALAEYLSLIHI